MLIRQRKLEKSPKSLSLPCNSSLWKEHDCISLRTIRLGIRKCSRIWYIFKIRAILGIAPAELQNWNQHEGEELRNIEFWSALPSCRNGGKCFRAALSRAMLMYFKSVSVFLINFSIQKRSIANNEDTDYPSEEGRLIDNLLSRYKPFKALARPVRHPNATVVVTMDAHLLLIHDFDEKDQVLHTRMWKEFVSSYTNSRKRILNIQSTSLFCVKICVLLWCQTLVHGTIRHLKLLAPKQENQKYSSGCREEKFFCSTPVESQVKPCKKLQWYFFPPINLLLFVPFLYRCVLIFYIALFVFSSA